MKKLWICTLLLSSLCTQAFAQSDVNSKENRVTARIQLAAEFYNQKQYTSALQELKTAEEIYEDYAPLQSMIALIYSEIDRPNEAERAYKYALKLDRNNPDLFNNYGWFLCTQKRYDEGLKFLNQALDHVMYKTPEKAAYNAGRCARLKNDTPLAIRYFHRGLEIAPKSTAVLYELAKIQFDDKKYTVVQEVIDQIHETEGKSAKSLWLGILTERALGHRVEVESYGGQLVKYFPESPEAAKWKTKTFE